MNPTELIYTLNKENKDVNKQFKMFKNDGPGVTLLFSYSAPEVNAEHYSQQAYLEMINVVSCSGCQKSKV